MWLSPFKFKFLFSLAHLILSRLLLEALGPCCRHDEVVAVARYFVSCLLITVLVAGSCARSPHQISQSPLAAHRRQQRGGGSACNHLAPKPPDPLSRSLQSHSSNSLSSESLFITVSDIHTLSQSSQCPPLTHTQIWTEYCG